MEELDFPKFYNSRTGVIQVTPDALGGINLEAAKVVGEQKYDFKNKIVASLTVAERQKIIRMIKNFEKDLQSPSVLAAKAKAEKENKKQFYLESPVTFNHHKSSKPKNITVQRQVYQGKKQFVIGIELVNRTGEVYPKHLQSIEEDDYETLKDILVHSIVLSTYARVNKMDEFYSFNLKVKGAKEVYKITLPKNIASGDRFVNSSEKKLKVLFKEYNKPKNSWDLYAEYCE